MANKLTDAQRTANACPDCGDDPNDPGTHSNTCRRIAMGVPVRFGGAGRRDLQCGPPWGEWPDGVEPVNPLAKR